MHLVRKSGPIFVVGVPHSGTSLLAAHLGAHSRLSSSPESAFFVELAKMNVEELLERNAWPGRALDFLYSIKIEDVPAPEFCDISRETMVSYLKSRRPSVPATLEALTQQYMIALGKWRWIEHTPTHLFHLPTIRRYYPGAPVIRIVRDPRDVALSLLEAPFEISAFLDGLLEACALSEQSEPFFREDKNAYTVRFENLMATPETVMQELCGFIGENCEPGMVARPIEAPCGRGWPDRLSQEEKQQADAFAGEFLRKHEYAASTIDWSKQRFVNVFPCHWRTFGAWWDVLAPLAAQGVRFWPLHRGERPSMSVYLGSPDGAEWLGKNLVGRIARTIGTAWEIAGARLRGRPLHWVRPVQNGDGFGTCGGLLARLLRSANSGTPQIADTNFNRAAETGAMLEGVSHGNNKQVRGQ